MKMPCIGDIEASGLGIQSYPIEIAWSIPSGEIRSRLIRPAPEWGTYWEQAAEDLHGITRDMIQQQGVAAVDVAALMNADLHGEVLHFDGGDYDRRWLSQLFDAAGVQPTFGFGDFNTLLALAGVRDGGRRLESEMRARTDIGDLKLHRAAHDVKFLQRWYIRARGGMRY